VSPAKAWRAKLEVGDLVMMKSGHMAIITNVRYKFGKEHPDILPHVNVQYCDDNTEGSCSSWRIEEVL
tara:strand:+ start:102 stop:305 length:204 start_codon:yes stop_codon:yes gene_type:complete